MPGACRTRGLACEVKKHTRFIHLGLTRSDPAFPARWFYGLFRALPGDRALLSPSPAQWMSIVASLMPASRHQDHAASPSTIGALVFYANRVHRIPHPTFVTIAIRPSSRGGTRET